MSKTHRPSEAVAAENLPLAPTMTTESPAVGLRDTNDFYAEGDPLRWVDKSIVDEIKAVCGPSLLDLGCGVGGYSKTLMDAGFQVQALDVNPRYVEIAKKLKVHARKYDGFTLPLADASVDTVFMVEVLEHIPEPERMIAEVYRVARRNIVVTVPNNTQRLNTMVSWSHMLDADHKNCFPRDSLSELVRTRFPEVSVKQIASADLAIARDLLGGWAYRAYRLARAMGFIQDKLFFRLVATANK